MKKLTLLLISLMALAGLLVLRDVSDTESKKEEPTVDVSPEMQANRANFIEDLKGRNIIHKVEVPAKFPHVYVGPNFFPLSFDDKSNFISVIAAYHIAQDSKKNIVALYHWQTGKQIGRFDRYGLSLK